MIGVIAMKAFDFISDRFKSKETVALNRIQVEQEEQEIDRELSVKHLENEREREVTQMSGDFKLDALAMSNMKDSYSDEILRAVWLLPFVLIFIEPLQATIITGFKALESLPVWYITMVMLITVAELGLRTLFKR